MNHPMRLRLAKWALSAVMWLVGYVLGLLIVAGMVGYLKDFVVWLWAGH